jgi:hypothetical protein
MLWRVLLELVLLLVLLFAGSSFWSCFKAPKHLLTMLGDSADLRRVIALVMKSLSKTHNK